MRGLNRRLRRSTSVSQYVGEAPEYLCFPTHAYFYNLYVTSITECRCQGLPLCDSSFLYLCLYNTRETTFLSWSIRRRVYGKFSAVTYIIRVVSSCENKREKQKLVSSTVIAITDIGRYVLFKCVSMRVHVYVWVYVVYRYTYTSLPRRVYECLIHIYVNDNTSIKRYHKIIYSILNSTQGVPRGICKSRYLLRNEDFFFF